MADAGIGEAALVATAASSAAEAGTSAAALTAVSATGGGLLSGVTAGGIAGLLSSSIPYLSAAGGLISAGSALFKGQADNSIDQLQAGQYEDQALIAKTQAEQQQSARMQQLSTTLATQDAMRSGRGVDLYSPTGLNIRQVSQAAEVRDLDTISLNGIDQQSQDATAASLALQKGTNDVIGSVGDAGKGLLSSADAFQALIAPKPKNSSDS